MSYHYHGKLARVVLFAACGMVGCWRAPAPDATPAVAPGSAPSSAAADVAPGDTPDNGPVGAVPADKPPTASHTQPEAAHPPFGGPRFTRVPAADSGLEFVHPLDLDHPLARIYYSGFATGGVAIGDVDGDGLPDVYLVSGPGSNRLFRQVRAWSFEDITEVAGVSGGAAWGAGAALADVDNDGDLDIFVCNYESPCQLFLNQGQGRFVEGAAAAGLAVSDACLMPAFADIDRDGDLDLYVVQNRLYAAKGRPAEMPVYTVAGRPVVKAEYDKLYGLRRLPNGGYALDYIGRTDLLFRNHGDGTFIDVSAEAGIGGTGQGLSAVWWDYNEDQWPDLYVANDFDDPDHLYRNNGDGTFTDVIGDLLRYTSWYSMGSDVGDVDGDGRIDLFVADMSPRAHAMRMLTLGAMNAKKLSAVAGPPQQTMRNTLLLNTGQERFVEAAGLAQLADTDWTWAAMIRRTTAGCSCAWWGRPAIVLVTERG